MLGTFFTRISTVHKRVVLAIGVLFLPIAVQFWAHEGPCFAISLSPLISDLLKLSLSSMSYSIRLLSGIIKPFQNYYNAKATYLVTLPVSSGIFYPYQLQKRHQDPRFCIYQLRASIHSNVSPDMGRCRSHAYASGSGNRIRALGIRRLTADPY